MTWLKVIWFSTAIWPSFYFLFIISCEAKHDMSVVRKNYCSSCGQWNGQHKAWQKDKLQGWLKENWTFSQLLHKIVRTDRRNRCKQSGKYWTPMAFRSHIEENRKFSVAVLHSFIVSDVSVCVCVCVVRAIKTIVWECHWPQLFSFYVQIDVFFLPEYKILCQNEATSKYGVCKLDNPQTASETSFWVCQSESD